MQCGLKESVKNKESLLQICGSCIKKICEINPYLYTKQEAIKLCNEKTNNNKEKSQEMLRKMYENFEIYGELL